MIIGLTGHMDAGKDTVADYLVEEHGFRKVGFSDELYAAICALWDITPEDALEFKNMDVKVTVHCRNASQLGPSSMRIPLGEYTWREHLQRFGTEMGREIWGEDFWVERFEHKYLHRYDNSDNLVVRDVRFDNEATMLGYYGGTIWQINRPGYEGDDHESEAGISDKHIDGDIDNDGTLEELYPVLDQWMKEMFQRDPISGST